MRQRARSLSADCRKDLTDYEGTPFKNQGDCVGYAATGGSNPGNG
jgi:hypothetical protein